MPFNIKWNKKTLNQFDEAIEHIEIDSSDNAEKVKEEILLTINSLLQTS